MPELPSDEPRDAQSYFEFLTGFHQTPHKLTTLEVAEIMANRFHLNLGRAAKILKAWKKQGGLTA